MDSSRRSARLVPVVLSLLHGPPPTRRGSSPDQAMEGDATPCPPDPAALRAGRYHVPQTPATGAATLGLRQPKDLTSLPCDVEWQHRSTQRKVPRGRHDEQHLTADIIELARQYGRYGYRKVAGRY